MTFFVILNDFRGRGSCWGAFQKPKFTPDKKFDANAPLNFALAFDFIFDGLSTHSRSKVAAILAKNTKIEVLTGGSKFWRKKTRPAIALIRNAQITQIHHGQVSYGHAGHFISLTAGRGGCFQGARSPPTYFFLYQIGPVLMERAQTVMIYYPLGYDVKAERAVYHHYLYPLDQNK